MFLPASIPAAASPYAVYAPMEADDEEKAKTELREMLAEAVRNTQPQTETKPKPKPLPKAKKGRR